MVSFNSPPAAVIFDMDGVLVDSNPFHLRKWADLLNEHRIRFNPDELPGLILGIRNDTSIRHFFGQQLSAQDVQRISEELEERFRRAFKPHAKPLPGLEALIVECHGASLPMAVASSAIAKNVQFIVDVLGFTLYFRHLVSGGEVIHPKPHPEIYLRAAEKLGVEPAGCVAFEDTHVGVEAAKRARMKCVAIASTFPLEELRERAQADLAVESFREVSLGDLRRLFRATSPNS